MLDFLIYRLFWVLLSPFLWLIVFIRRLQNKEDAVSHNHRFAKIEYGEKTHRRIFMHAASVGESMIALNIAQHLKGIDSTLQFAFTCQTRTAAQIIQNRKGEHDIFQFLPFDHPSIVKRFVKKLNPDLAVFIEGEIWPNLLSALRKKGVKTALINSRMTLQSIENWKKVKSLSNHAFNGFDFAHSANKLSHDFLSSFDINLSPIVSNLKFAAPSLEFDQNEVSQLKELIGSRPIWLCASSHEGEEEIIIKAHEILLRSDPDYLLIIAPRHTIRAGSIEKMCKELGFKSASRAKAEIPTAKDNVFIWDVLGQMGPFFKLSDIVFVAGSLLTNIGGHNPIEPAQLNCAVISGPFYHNFQDIYDEMVTKGGVIITKDTSESIANEILKIRPDNTILQKQINNAHEIVTNSGNLMSEIDQNLLKLLDSV